MQSLLALQDWLREVRENAHPNIVSLLVGNKTDLSEQREVSHEAGLDFLKRNGMDLFFEASAKSGDNVDHVLMCSLTQFVGLHGSSQADLSALPARRNVPALAEEQRTPHAAELGPEQQDTVTAPAPPR